MVDTATRSRETLWSSACISRMHQNSSAGPAMISAKRQLLGDGGGGDMATGGWLEPNVSMYKRWSDFSANTSSNWSLRRTTRKGQPPYMRKVSQK